MFHLIMLKWMLPVVHHSQKKKPKVLKINELKDIVLGTIVSIDNAFFKIGSNEMKLITKLSL